MSRSSVNTRTKVLAGGVTAVAVVGGLFAAGSAGASPLKKAPTEQEISALFDGWNKALQTGDPQAVADRYADDSVLLPTLSNEIRADRESRVEYFEHFLQKRPLGTKIESHINVLDEDSALDAGLYRFDLTNHETGEKSSVVARYTYEYEKRGGKWLIVNHHSSLLPEG